MGDVKGYVRMRQRETSSSTLARLGGAAACSAGASYGAWGYLDGPDAPELVIGAVLPVLELTTPALFLGGLVGLYFRLGARGGPLLARAGLLVGLLGTLLGVWAGVDRLPTPRYSGYWLLLLFVGLTLVGVAALLAEGSPKPLGASVLVSGALGWVSALTDTAFPVVLLVPARPVHVAFAALFCLSAIVWGWKLLRGPYNPMRPRP